MEQYRLYEEMLLGDRLIIGETDKCTICNKDFKYTFTKWRFPETPEGLYEVKMKTEHLACRSLVRKIDKLKDEILNLEFELFRKQYN